MSLVVRTIVEDGVVIVLHPDGDPCEYIDVQQRIDGSYDIVYINHYMDEYGNTVTIKDNRRI